MTLEQIDRRGIVVVEHEKTFDVERGHTICRAANIERLGRSAQLLDKDQGRARCAAGITAASSKTLNDAKTEPALLRKGAANRQVTADVFPKDFMLALRVLFENGTIEPCIGFLNHRPSPEWRNEVTI